ncbi:MAG: aldo/keto reductase [Deltaproteobacteria bacterium]|jgi:predicted aldo/keto reductase-like oxidoreductase|nr:aldo/keto reductase [Deltaproteobacteria bacterium]
MIETRAIGASGVKGSILGFGCMRLPLNSRDKSDINFDLAQKMVRTAIDRGVNYLDTAFPYHSGGGMAAPGASEPFLAQALKDGYRDKVLLATKLPIWLLESQADAHKYLDLQLKRLNVRQIDFYLAHGINAPMWEKLQSFRIQDFFDQAVRDGRIRFPSFSFHDSYLLFEKVIKAYDWVMTQVQYNYLDQEYQAGRAGVTLAAKRGVGVVVMEPLRGGFLVDQIPQDQVDSLKEVRPDWSLPAWGFNWLWNQPDIAVVLSGMSDLAQVTENLTLAENYAQGLFTAQEVTAINKVLAFFNNRLKANCTSCGYCLPCPEGVNIPMVLASLNNFFLFDGRRARKLCVHLYNAQLTVEERAASCVLCGQCQEKCPQAFDIPQLMTQITTLYNDFTNSLSKS